MARIVRRTRLVPNIHLLEVEAPEVARSCRPGQFVIVMPDAHGERIPLTVANWNPEAGTVTAVGTSTHKLSVLESGDEIAVFTGPLGLPSEIRNYGTVLLAGGCFGIAAITPIARALKEAGNKVLVLIDAKADYLLYWEDRLADSSDAVFISSRDARFPPSEYVPAKVKEVLQMERVDLIHAVGCTYLMYRVGEASRPFGVKTTVSLNPIMVDGTGMCGACRVTVDGKTKFACVDGPDFDAHLVDWKELFARRTSYMDDEGRSLCRWEDEAYG